MTHLLLSFLVSFLFSALIIRASRDWGYQGRDSDLFGPQKFHVIAVPRIGGVALFAGVLCAVVYPWLHLGLRQPSAGILLMFSALPAFLVGLTEDCTKNVKPVWRLVAAGVSAVLAIVLLQAQISRADIPGLDWLLSTSLGAFAATVFTVAGVANAVNIIDGFNGLSSMCVGLMLLAFAYVAHQVGDTELVLISLAGVGAIMGFFVWNYPAGRLFLGDGGSYFLGFFLAEVGVLLISRHSEVSPLFALMVCIYPVFETVFSMYRRRVLRAVSAGQPDGIHLHSLIYRRIMRWTFGARDARAMTRRNSMTAPYLWTLCVSSLAPALLFWDSTPMLLACMLLFGVTYVGLYWRIVRFRTPRWMVFRGDVMGGKVPPVVVKAADKPE
ncbi:MraY family glycosyltransferase [Roseateles albus]|uniref:Glycosyltransferase n=1 Tax=Roseateles albus TaxID=2987525 RepID=A0ABT5KFP8_9BURK|nr:glycosyltransferase [Roseateles albus]MDC8772747.1 glycosyltransferase [Roseateles albus]